MKESGIDEARLDEILDPEQKEQLLEEIELLDGASAEFDQKLVDEGKLSGMFWFCTYQFWCGNLLKHFLKMTSSPLPRKADIGEIDPMKEDFSAFVFKIQANMNKNHRDRIAFMRICSGKFEAAKRSLHVQGNKKMRPSATTDDGTGSSCGRRGLCRDVIGVFDPGIFSMGMRCWPGKSWNEILLA